VLITKQAGKHKTFIKLQSAVPGEITRVVLFYLFTACCLRPESTL